MSPVSRRTGKRYAAGSHMVRGGYPRTCHGCGEPVPLDDCWQEALQGGRVKLTWHHRCRVKPP